MAHIGFTLDALKKLIEYYGDSDDYYKNMYNEKKAYLDSLKSSKGDIKTKKKYKEIMNNPKISDKSKDKLKKQTKNGSKATIEDLEAFEKIELAMDEDWDEEKTKKKSNKYRPEKDNKEIMKASSRMTKVGDKHYIDTNLKVHKKLKDKSDQSKLLQSVENALKKEFKQINGGYIIDFEGGNINSPKNEKDIMMENIKKNIAFIEFINNNKYKGINIRPKILNDINEKLVEIKDDIEEEIDKESDEDEKDAIKQKLKEMEGEFKLNRWLYYNGKGISDNKIKGKMLKHLTEHIADYDEPIDPKDYNQAKELIDNIRNDKKKRGRPKKDKIKKVEIVKKLPYQKFSHAKNSSLEQLLQAKAEKEDLDIKNLNKDVLTKQKEIMKLLGF